MENKNNSINNKFAYISDVFSLFHKNMQNKKSTRIKNNKGKTEKQEQKKEKN